MRKNNHGQTCCEADLTTSGRIFFDGTDTTMVNSETLRILRRKMQIIFQDPYASLNPRMKIGDAVGHPLEIHGIAYHDEKRKKVLEILNRLVYHLQTSLWICTHTR